MSAKFRFILGDVRLSAWNFALQAYEMAALLPSLTIHHTCPCGTNWWDEWDCLCNDRCPTCDAEIEPDEHEAIQGANSAKIRTLNDRRVDPCPEPALTSGAPPATQAETTGRASPPGAIARLGAVLSAWRLLALACRPAVSNQRFALWNAARSCRELRCQPRRRCSARRAGHANHQPGCIASHVLEPLLPLHDREN